MGVRAPTDSIDSLDLPVFSRDPNEATSSYVRDSVHHLHLPQNAYRARSNTGSSGSCHRYEFLQHIPSGSQLPEPFLRERGRRSLPTRRRSRALSDERPSGSGSGSGFGAAPESSSFHVPSELLATVLRSDVSLESLQDTLPVPPRVPSVLLRQDHFGSTPDLSYRHIPERPSNPVGSSAFHFVPFTRALPLFRLQPAQAHNIFRIDSDPLPPEPPPLTESERLDMELARILETLWRAEEAGGRLRGAGVVGGGGNAEAGDEENLHAYLAATGMSNAECAVCLDEKMCTRTPCCDTRICLGCMQEYVASKVRQGLVRVPCPSAEGRCRKLLERTVIMSFLEVELRARFQALLVDANLDPHTRTCPHCSTPHSLDATERALLSKKRRSEVRRTGLRIECAECGRFWCFQCHACALLLSNLLW